MQYILDCVTMLSNAIFCFYLLFRKYPIRKRHWFKRIALLLLVMGAKAIVLYFQIAPLNFLFGCLLILLEIKLLFQCDKVAWILYAMLFTIIALVADAFGVSIVSVFHHNTIITTIHTVTLTLECHIWNWIVQIILTRVSKIIIQRKENLCIRWHEILFYIFIVVLEVGIFAYFSLTESENSTGIAVLTFMISFFLLDFYIMYVFHKMSQLREKERQADLMQQQEHLQLQMYQELQTMYERTCSSAHDINRHIRTLKLWLQDKDTKEVDPYISDLSKAVSQLQPYIHNQNPILEIILNTAFFRCDAEGIQLNMEIEDFLMTFVSDMDITTIFSNLLDNAIDACMDEKCKEKRIEIVLRKSMGLIALRILNTCGEINHGIPEKWHSTKADHMGIGLSNVSQTVKKYDGVMSVKTKLNLFQVSITIQ